MTRIKKQNNNNDNDKNERRSSATTNALLLVANVASNLFGVKKNSIPKGIVAGSATKGRQQQLAIENIPAAVAQYNHRNNRVVRVQGARRGFRNRQQLRYNAPCSDLFALDTQARKSIFNAVRQNFSAKLLPAIKDEEDAAAETFEMFDVEGRITF
jgi:hypothetical protein